MSEETRNYPEDENKEVYNSEESLSEESLSEESVSEEEYEEINDEDEEEVPSSSRRVVTTVIQEEKTKRSNTLIIIIAAIILILLVLFFCIKNYMPDFLINRADNCMKKGEYEKALNYYTTVANSRPLDTRPVVGQVTALSKLPMTYERQKLLYEISQLDDFDEASARAEKVLNALRGILNEKIGTSYIDNILFDGQLLRWNKSQPITYSAGFDNNVPEEIINATKEAFGSWSNAMNGEISFKETPGNPNSNIVVHFIDPQHGEGILEHNLNSVASVPRMKDNVLQRVDIYIKPTDNSGMFLDYNTIYNLTIHQIGHALGLWGHSADNNDIMAHANEYPYDNFNLNVISERDINTLKAIYNMVPDVTDIPLKQSETVNMNYHRILTTYPGENFKQEMAEIINQLRNNNLDIVAWVDLAINYAVAKQYERSNYILKNISPLVIDDLPNHYVVLYNIAANYYRMKNYEASRRYLTYATEIEDDMDSQILDAFLDLKLKNTDLAKDKLLILQRQYPDNIEIALKLAEIYFIKSNKKAEEEVIRKLLQHNPDAKKDRRVAKYLKQKNEPVKPDNVNNDGSGTYNQTYKNNNPEPVQYNQNADEQQPQPEMSEQQPQPEMPEQQPQNEELNKGAEGEPAIPTPEEWNNGEQPQG